MDNNNHVNTIEVIQACAFAAAAEMAHKLPANLLATLMAANNRVLKAAIIEHGGELRISPAAVCEMLENSGHVVASAEHDGMLRLRVAGKDKAGEPNSNILPL